MKESDSYPSMVVGEGVLWEKMEVAKCELRVKAISGVPVQHPEEPTRY